MDPPLMINFRGSVSLVLYLCFAVACSASASEFDDSSSSSSNFLELLQKSDPSSSASSENFAWHSGLDFLKPQSLQIQGEDSCRKSYGFLPCSASLGGSAFLLLFYGYCFYTAATLITEGCDRLLGAMPPGPFTGVLLPILGAVPDAFVILAAVSGISANREEVQAQVLVGIEFLVGSSVMLLTLLWGGTISLGRSKFKTSREDKSIGDPEQGTFSNATDCSWKQSLTETGVKINPKDLQSPWIMVATVLPFLVAQSPVMFGDPSEVAVKAGGVLALLGLASYLTYQVVYSSVREKSVERAKKKYAVNTSTLETVFNSVDKNKDGKWSRMELRAFIVGLSFQYKGQIPDNQKLQEWLKYFDTGNSTDNTPGPDGQVSKEEFITGIVEFVEIMEYGDPEKDVGRLFPSSEASYQKDAMWSLGDFLADQQGGYLMCYAVLYLIGGIALSAIAADPFVNVIFDLSKATGVSPFLISFVAIPVASNLGKGVLSRSSFMKRGRLHVTIIFSKIYEVVTMNNTMCLAIFLAVVSFRGLTWNFPSEVLVILIVHALIGSWASVRSTFPLWIGLVALILYPASIALIVILKVTLGW